jgi:hypothetical protein
MPLVSWRLPATSRMFRVTGCLGVAGTAAGLGGLSDAEGDGEEHALSAPASNRHPAAAARRRRLALVI